MTSLLLKPRIGRNMGMRSRSHRSTIEHQLAAATRKPVLAKRLPLQEYDKKATDDLIAEADGSSVEYLGGKPVQSQLVQVSLDKIDIWTANPRTFCACDADDRTPAEELDILLKGHKTAELALQLAYNGGVPEALEPIRELQRLLA